MTTISKRSYPTNPDVKQGPTGRGRRSTSKASTSAKKVVDIPTPDPVISDIINAQEPIEVPEPAPVTVATQEIPLTEQTSTPEETTTLTRVFQLEKLTKYGAVIYRDPELGTAIFTKTEFPGEPPTSVTITAAFKNPAAVHLTASAQEKLQKAQEKAQAQLKKTQDRLAKISAKLGVPVEGAEPTPEPTV